MKSSGGQVEFKDMTITSPLQGNFAGEEFLAAVLTSHHLAGTFAGRFGLGESEAWPDGAEAGAEVLNGCRLR